MMETKIFELIFNTGGMALVLAILFFYSLTSYKQSSRERTELRKELNELQTDYHNFKDNMIERLLDSQDKFSEALSFFSAVLDKKIS